MCKVERHICDKFILFRLLRLLLPFSHVCNANNNKIFTRLKLHVVRRTSKEMDSKNSNDSDWTLCILASEYGRFPFDMDLDGDWPLITNQYSNKCIVASIDGATKIPRIKKCNEFNKYNSNNSNNNLVGRCVECVCVCCFVCGRRMHVMRDIERPNWDQSKWP